MNKRLLWTPELRKLFKKTVEDMIPVVKKITPCEILRRMEVPGLTRKHIASHYQKYKKKKIKEIEKSKEKI